MGGSQALFTLTIRGQEMNSRRKSLEIPETVWLLTRSLLAEIHYLQQIQNLLYFLYLWNILK